MELIDSHCHLGFDELAGDIEAVIRRSIAAGVTGWLNVGTDIEQDQKVIELASRFENMYAAVGIHPHYAKDVTYEAINRLKKLSQHKKVVAIGETGLDFHYDFSQPAEQKKLFIEHLKIASQLNLPVIVHCRQAFDETMETLDTFSAGAEKIVFHCFSGTAEQAQLVLEKGFFISFTGVVTFKNAESTRQAAKVVPPARLMLETDCPYMSPEPVRSQKINEPALMVHTAESLARLKGLETAAFTKRVTETTRNFFNIRLR